MGTSSPSTLAMLLQMVFEKYAKAALLRQGAVSVEWARSNHGAASRMLLVMRRQRAVLHPLGGAKVWEDVLGLVSELERAHPQLAHPNAPHLEYPWVDVHGEICWPARDLSIATSLGDPTKNLARRVVSFAEKMDELFDVMFA